MSRTRTLLWGIIVIVALLRLGLLDRGALAYPDELRYGNSLNAAHALLDGDGQRFAFAVSTADARPGFVVLYLPAALLQIAVASSAGESMTYPLILIPLLFQLLLSLSLPWLFFMLARHWWADRDALLLGATLAYGLLANSMAYVRHILPYDGALALSLLGLWWALRFRLESRWRAELLGCLAALSVTIYPGYYFFPLIILAVCLWRVGFARGSTSVLSCGLRFGISGAAVTLGFEGLARLAERSYLSDLRELSGTITQGSFEEGATFLMRYLIEVEGLAGWPWLILPAAALPLAVLAWRGPATQHSRATWIPMAIATCTMFGYQILASVGLHKMVFYGRLVHAYVPFLLLTGCAVIAYFMPRRHDRIAGGVLALIALVGLVQFYPGYRMLAYPRDVVRTQLAAHAEFAVVNQRTLNEATSDPAYGDFRRELQRGQSTPKAAARYETLWVNLGFFYPVQSGDQELYIPGPGEQLLFDGRHWLAHPTVTFEGNTIEERRILKQWDPHVRVYRRALEEAPL